MSPKRIHRKRTKGWRMPSNAVYVGRPGYFGNPFEGPRAAADYRRWLSGKMSRAEFAKKSTQPFALYSDRRNVHREMVALRGKDLACWCPLPKDGEPDLCHAAVLIELSNAPEPDREG